MVSGLSMERTGKVSLEDEIAQLRAEQRRILFPVVHALAEGHRARADRVEVVGAARKRRRGADTTTNQCPLLIPDA